MTWLYSNSCMVNLGIVKIVIINVDTDNLDTDNIDSDIIDIANTIPFLNFLEW